MSNQELPPDDNAARRRELEALLFRHLPALRAFVRPRLDPALRARESASDLVQSICLEVIADDALSAVYCQSLTPSHEAMNQEGVDHIERALDQLLERDKEIVLLARIVGLSRREIAERLGLTEDAVRNRLHRALRKLAAILATES